MQLVLSKSGEELNRDVEAYAVTAMAQWQLKQPDAGRAALAKGVEIVETKFPKLAKDSLSHGWLDRIIANVLLREAKALIEKPKVASDEKK